VAPPERRAALARQGERIAAFLLERLAAARARAGAPSTDA